MIIFFTKNLNFEINNKIYAFKVEYIIFDLKLNNYSNRILSIIDNLRIELCTVFISAIFYDYWILLQ